MREASSNRKAEQYYVDCYYEYGFEDRSIESVLTSVIGAADVLRELFKLAAKLRDLISGGGCAMLLS